MKAAACLKYLILSITLMTLNSKVYSQQLLWTTASDAKEKKIPKSQVINEILKQYDFYEYYVDATGYTKTTFSTMLKEGKSVLGASASKNPKIDSRLNGIRHPSISAIKDNTGSGSLVIVLSLNGDNVDMLIFSNDPTLGAISTATYKRTKFTNWIKSVLKLETDLHEQNEKNNGFDTSILAPPVSISEFSVARTYKINDNTNLIEPPELKLSDEPLENVAVKAAFPGGESAFRDFVASEFQYPKRCQDERIQGSVVLRFVVDQSGRISRVRPISETTSCPEFTKEAIRVIQNSPLWIPGQQKGRFVTSWREIPIRLSTE